MGTVSETEVAVKKFRQGAPAKGSEGLLSRFGKGKKRFPQWPVVLPLEARQHAWEPRNIGDMQNKKGGTEYNAC